MEKFTERHKLPKLTYREIESLSRPVQVKTSNQWSKLPPKQSPGPESIIGEFYQKFKEDLTQSFCSSQKPRNLP